MADPTYKFTGVNTAQLENEVRILRQNSSTFRAMEAAATAAGYKTIEIQMGPGLLPGDVADSSKTNSSTRTIRISSDATGSWGIGGRQATVGEVIAHELAHAVVPKEFEERHRIDPTESGREGMWVRHQAGQVANDLGLPGANNADYLITRIPVDKEQACTRRNPGATTPEDGVLFLDGSRGYNGRGSTVPPGSSAQDPSTSRQLATDETGQEIKPAGSDSSLPPRWLSRVARPPIADSFNNSGAFDDRFGNWGSAPASIAPSPAPDRPESFDNRFGNWGTAPAGRFGDTRSPVLRALEKYSGSAVPDGSISAPAQGVSWGMPASPPNSIGTGGVLGNYMDPSLIAPAQGALPAGPVSSGPIAPDLPSDETAGSNPVRYVSGRIRGQPQASISNIGAQAAPPSPERSRPLVGIFSGQPMLPFPLPSSLWSRRDDNRAPDDDEEERSSRWLRLLSPS